MNLLKIFPKESISFYPYKGNGLFPCFTLVASGSLPQIPCLQRQLLHHLSPTVPPLGPCTVSSKGPLPSPWAAPAARTQERHRIGDTPSSDREPERKIIIDFMSIYDIPNTVVVFHVIVIAAHETAQPHFLLNTDRGSGLKIFFSLYNRHVY